MLRTDTARLRRTRVWRWAILAVVTATAARASVPAPTTSIAAPSQETPSEVSAASWIARLNGLSKYERDVLNRVLAERNLALDLHPAGKSIDSIQVETLDVFEDADPVPGWVNWFHATTRREVVEREVLTRAGQTYDQRTIDETARNLRSVRQLSLVLLVPIKPREASPKRVGLLVITKDVWSLRLNTNFRARNGAIEYLVLQPSEENLFGSHLTFSGQYVYDLSTNTFGGAISHQRLFGSRIRASLALNAIQHRSTGQFEGSSGAFAFGQPLYSSRTKWGWGTSLSWLDRVNRALLPAPDGTYVPRLYRDPDDPAAEAIPYRYHSRTLQWQTAITRSFGFEQKWNLSFGLEAQQRRFDANGLLAEGYAPVAVRRFETNALERKSVRIGTFVQLESYRNDFVSMVDVETLGLQEDLQLGPRAFVKIYTGAKRALASRDVLGVSAGLQYSVHVSGALMRLWGTHLSELSPRQEDRDGLVQTGVRLVTPSLGVGRFVYDGGLLYHYRNSRNFRYALGGDNRLRGFPSEQFLGQHLVTSNLEFRTRSVKLLEVMFGLVAFYDIGDAFDSMQALHPKHSVGIGGRATLPQFQRVVGRLDLAFPLSSPVSNGNERWNPMALFLTLEGQAFPIPVVQPATTRTPILSPPE